MFLCIIASQYVFSPLSLTSRYYDQQLLHKLGSSFQTSNLVMLSTNLMASITTITIVEMSLMAPCHPSQCSSSILPGTHWNPSPSFLSFPSSLSPHITQNFFLVTHPCHHPWHSPVSHAACLFPNFFSHCIVAHLKSLLAPLCHPFSLTSCSKIINF